MNRFATSLVALTLAFAATACEDAPTYPDDDYDPEDYAQHDFSVRDPGFGFELPPLEPQPTFWSCAAGHEGNFADAAARIIQLETKAWFESDYRIQQALLRLMQGRTSFVIAHRLSTIRDADNVVVINRGEIVEQGTHQELLDKRGFYHHLYVSQFKGQAI